MSLLHRNIVAAAFQEMLKKFEPIAIETGEALVKVFVPGASPLVNAAVDIVSGAMTSDHVAAGVAAAGAPPTVPTSVAVAPPVAPAAPAATAPQNQAVLAAVDALGLQLSQLATQLAALRSNIAP